MRKTLKRKNRVTNDDEQENDRKTFEMKMKTGDEKTAHEFISFYMEKMEHET